MRNFRFDNKFQFPTKKMQMTVLVLPAWQAFVSLVFCLQGHSGTNKSHFDRQKVSKPSNRIINSALNFLKSVCVYDSYLEFHFYGKHLYLIPSSQVLGGHDSTELCVWCNK